CYFLRYITTNNCRTALSRKITTMALRRSTSQMLQELISLLVVATCGATMRGPVGGGTEVTQTQQSCFHGWKRAGCGGKRDT
ncbi:hypothetical protein NQZ68_015704, partial [Dissostichus eleginoides]